MNLINHHFPNVLGIPVMFFQLTNLTSALMEWIPQREKERGSRERQQERGRGSSREDWSPLRNDGIPVKLLQAEGSDHTDARWETQNQPAKPSGVRRGREEKRRAGAMTLTTVRQLLLLYLLWLCGTWSTTGGWTFCFIQTRGGRRWFGLWMILFFRFEPKLFSNERARVPLTEPTSSFLPLLV